MKGAEGEWSGALVRPSKPPPAALMGQANDGGGLPNAPPPPPLGCCIRPLPPSWKKPQLGPRPLLLRCYTHTCFCPPSPFSPSERTSRVSVCVFSLRFHLVFIHLLPPLLLIERSGWGEEKLEEPPFLFHPSSPVWHTINGPCGSVNFEVESREKKYQCLISFSFLVCGDTHSLLFFWQRRRELRDCECAWLVQRIPPPCHISRQTRTSPYL